MYGAYGIHPLYSYEYTEEEERKKIEAMSNPKTVAWGEIGLDYHDFGSKYSYATPEQQKPGTFSKILPFNHQNCIIIFYGLHLICLSTHFQHSQDYYSYVISFYITNQTCTRLP